MKHEEHRRALLILGLLIITLASLAIKFNSTFLYFLTGFFFSTLLEEAMSANKKLKELNND